MANLIASVQTGEITIAAGASSNTATISSVNTSYAVVFFNGWRSADTALLTSEDYPRLALTNSTTVTAQTHAANAGETRIVRYTVVEFSSFAVSSVQQGTIAINGTTSNTATISSVTTSRSFVMHLGQTHSQDHRDFNYNQATIFLTNSTTVTATKDNSLFPVLTVGFVVVELASGIATSIQQLTVAIAASSATGDATISSVNDTSSLLVWGGWNMHLFASNTPQRLPYIHRTSTTNVRATRGSTSSTSEDVCCTVIEFDPQWVNARYAGQTAITSGNASANAAITSVDTTKSLLSWLNMTINFVDVGDYPYATAKIDSASQVTVERGGSPTYTCTCSWEVMEFADVATGGVSPLINTGLTDRGLINSGFLG